MRFLIDENVSGSVIRYLRDQGHDVVCVADENVGMKDERILELAINTKRIILTYDTDFGDLVFRDRKPHGGIVLVRLRVDNTNLHVEALTQFLKKHDEKEIQGGFWRLDEDYFENTIDY